MRKRRGLWGVLLVLALAAAVVAFFPRPRLLLDRAKKVANRSDWLDTLPNLNLGSYHWLSDHELLFGKAGGEVCLLYRLDVRTGVRTRLEGLESRLVDALGETSVMETSPDGKWLLWTVDNSYRHAATLDGTQFLTWDTGRQWNQELPCWLPDSRHWMEFTMDPLDRRYCEARIYDVTAPQEVKVIPMAVPATGMQQIDAVTAENHLVVQASGETQTASSAPPAPRKDLLLYSMKTEIGRPKEVVLPVARWQQPNGLRVSPDGARVAWIQFRDFDPSPTSLFIHRYWARFPAEVKHTTEIWVSRVDGTDAWEIGHVFTESPNPDALSALRWLPDGQSLSFYHDATLYMVPVN